MADTVDSRQKYERMTRAQLIETLEQLKREVEAGRPAEPMRCLADGLPAANDSGTHGLTDAADSARVATALRKSETLFKKTERLARIGYLEWDEVEGRCIHCSEGLAELLGTTPEDYIETSNSKDSELIWIHPADRERRMQKDLAFRTGGETYDVEYRHLKRNGEVIDVREVAEAVRDDQGRIIRSIGYIQDISDRKRIERAFRESEAREAAARAQLSEAIETLSEGFAWYDEEDRLVLFNGTYVEIYDKSRDLIVPGACFEDIIREGAERGQYRDAVGRVDEWVAERLARHRDPSGPFHQHLDDNRWVQISERRLPGGGIVGIRTDITWPKEMEQELRSKERLATLGQLTATVSHELRNPLGALRSAVSAIRKLVDPCDEPLLLRSIKVAERSVNRCVNIISELLDFARTTNLTSCPTKVDPWIMSVIEEFDFPEGLKVDRELGCGREVALDHDRMRRVMVNLLDNACHAMLDEKRKTLTAAGHSLTVRTQTAGDEVSITVSDTGHGITAEDLPRIFEPLYSTKTYGVGLGLSFVKQVIEQHAGSVHVDSTEGSGTVVRLSLPIHASSETSGTSVQR